MQGNLKDLISCAKIQRFETVPDICLE